MPKLSLGWGEKLSSTFYGRLFWSQLAASTALILTVAVVAAAIGPGLFNQYLAENGLPRPADIGAVEDAFIRALWIALAIAELAAFGMAMAIGTAIVLPVRRRLRDLSIAARRLAAGDFDLRVEPDDYAGEEIEALATSFNTMAEKLGGVEAARRRLLDDLAHELRTPLASLRVTIEAIGDGVLQPDDATLATLTEQTGRLSRLATDLRNISDATGGLSVRIASCPVASLLENARAAAAEDFARNGVSLTIEGAPTGDVLADAQRIGQVMANLLSNALRHTPAGGAVTLAATTEGKCTYITVSDTGDGISPEHLPHLFERFYRTDTARSREEGGTGIGLAVCAAIAAAHDGALSVDSPGEGMGAVFTLILPTADYAWANESTPGCCRGGDRQAPPTPNLT